MKFSMKDFFSKRDKKTLMEDFILCTVCCNQLRRTGFINKWAFYAQMNRGRLYGELLFMTSYMESFLDSHTNLLSELCRKPNLGELAVNGNSPNC